MHSTYASSSLEIIYWVLAIAMNFPISRINQKEHNLGFEVHWSSGFVSLPGEADDNLTLSITS